MIDKDIETVRGHLYVSFEGEQALDRIERRLAAAEPPRPPRSPESWRCLMAERRERVSGDIETAKRGLTEDFSAIEDDLAMLAMSGDSLLRLARIERRLSRLEAIEAAARTKGKPDICGLCASGSPCEYHLWAELGPALAAAEEPTDQLKENG